MTHPKLSLPLLYWLLLLLLPCLLIEVTAQEHNQSYNSPKASEEVPVEVSIKDVAINKSKGSVKDSSNDSLNINTNETTKDIPKNITTAVSPKTKTADNQSNTNNADTQWLWISILLFLMVVMVVTILYFYRKKGSAKAIVYKEYAYIELSRSKQQLGLYRRHQKSTNTVINLVDIIQFNIKLNGTIICSINPQAENGFSAEYENDMLLAFKKEHVIKMIDKRIRQISVLMTTKDNKSVTVCLYLRKGSNRITKHSYSNIINEVMDWCWLFSEKINPEHTGTREIKASEDQVVPLHKQATISPNTGNEPQSTNTPVAKNPVVVPISDNVSTDADTSTHEKAEQEIEEKKNANANANANANDGEKSPTKNSNTTDIIEDGAPANTNPTINHRIVDTELVDALEKLVNLKQQGFLTLDEFNQAKTKLLQDLYKN